eukprot:16275944-Heterocapsa_arctica.AAC.1
MRVPDGQVPEGRLNVRKLQAQQLQREQVVQEVTATSAETSGAGHERNARIRRRHAQGCKAAVVPFPKVRGSLEAQG